MEPPSDDLCKSTEELLAELHELSVSGASPTNPAFNTLLGLRAMRKFACVLTVLGRQADEQTRRIVKLTWGLFWVTLLLAIIAAGQIAIMLVEHFGKAH